MVTKEQVCDHLEECGVMDRWRNTLRDKFLQEQVVVGKGGAASRGGDGGGGEGVHQGVSLRDKLRREAAELLERSGSMQQLVEECARANTDIDNSSSSSSNGDGGDKLERLLVERVRAALYEQSQTVRNVKMFVYNMLHGGGDDTDGAGDDGGSSSSSSSSNNSSLAEEISSTVAQTVTELQLQQQKEYHRAVDSRAREVALHSGKIPLSANKATQRPTAHIAATMMAQRRIRNHSSSKKRKRRMTVIDEEEEQQDAESSDEGGNDSVYGGDPLHHVDNGRGEKRVKTEGERAVVVERGRKTFDDLFGGDSSGGEEEEQQQQQQKGEKKVDEEQQDKVLGDRDDDNVAVAAVQETAGSQEQGERQVPIEEEGSGIAHSVNSGGNDANTTSGGGGSDGSGAADTMMDTTSDQ